MKNLKIVICMMLVCLFINLGCSKAEPRPKHRSVYSNEVTKDLYLITNNGELKLLYSNIKTDYHSYNGMTAVFLTEDGQSVRIAGSYAVVVRKQ